MLSSLGCHSSLVVTALKDSQPGRVCVSWASHPLGPLQLCPGHLCHLQWGLGPKWANAFCQSGSGGLAEPSSLQQFLWEFRNAADVLCLG